MGGMSSDNIHGLILALSSSLFIGSSFIIKKKGLMKAGATGIRAGNFLFYLTLNLIIYLFVLEYIICVYSIYSASVCLDFMK